MLEDETPEEYRERHARYKTWLFVGVFAAALALILILYSVGSQTAVESADDAAATDSVAADAATLGAPVPVDSLPADSLAAPADSL